MNAPVNLPQPIATGPIDISTRGAWAQLATLVQAFKASPERWTLLSFPVCATLVIAVIAAAQVRLNAWQGALYDALQRHDLNVFLQQLVVFIEIVAVLLLLVVTQTWLTEVSKVRLRAWLTRDLLDEWLRPKRAYLFVYAGDIGVNPDQRIQEDARHLTELSADLGGGLAQSSLLLVSFIGVLWVLSGQVVFNIDSRDFSIPGYMVWCALAYASAGSWLTWRVGRPLVGLNADHYAREAEFRVALVRVVEHVESVALYHGEADERASLDIVLAAVLSVTRKLAGGLARLTWITSGYGWLAIIAPFLMAAPGYFGGRLSLGSLMIVVGAFNQVQSSLRWFVDNFSRIADWRATLFRVVAMREALRSIEHLHAAEGRIALSDHPEGKLALEGVEVYLPGSLTECVTLEETKVEIGAGEHVLMTGESAAGKRPYFSRWQACGLGAAARFSSHRASRCCSCRSGPICRWDHYGARSLIRPRRQASATRRCAQRSRASGSSAWQARSTSRDAGITICLSTSSRLSALLGSCCMPRNGCSSMMRWERWSRRSATP